MVETGSNNTRKTASTAMLGAVVDIAHSVAYPMVSEVIKTQASLTNRIEHNELMIEDNTLEVQTLSTRMDEVTAQATTAVADAIANMQNAPEMDETIAKMQSEINRLQAQVAGLVEVLSSVAHLE
jgi:methyl-accepting chemotaxis protein